MNLISIRYRGTFGTNLVSLAFIIAEFSTFKQIGRQTDREADRQRDRQTDTAWGTLRKIYKAAEHPLHNL